MVMAMTPIVAPQVLVQAALVSMQQIRGMKSAMWITAKIQMQT